MKRWTLASTSASLIAFGATAILSSFLISTLPVRAQSRIAQCVGELIELGVSPDEAAKSCNNLLQQPDANAQPTGEQTPSSPAPAPSPASETPTNRPDNSSANNPAVQYRCIDWQNSPTTVAYTPRGPIAVIVWKSTIFAGGGYTPEVRCQQVTARFQHHSEAGHLRHISYGTINDQKVICVANKLNSQGRTYYQCQDNGLLLTLASNDNPETVLRQLFNVASQTDSRPVQRGGKTAIDINEFFQNAQTIE